MYGTIARVRAKPGMEAKLLEVSERSSSRPDADIVAEYIYRMDQEPDVYYLAVVFESKEAYWRNANSPEQHARYQEYRALLEEDPEWHDGEIIFSHAR